jgi:inosine-uridine nucleoside N-ribohydrolase
MKRFALGLLLLPAVCTGARETVLFDNDPGLFGDDGAALVMLLRSPQQIAIPGVTLVAGNVWTGQGAEYTFHILDLLKQPQIPVYIGSETPLLHTTAMAREEDRRWGKIAYNGAFGTDPSEVKPAPGGRLVGRKARHDGVAFLISEIERHPGEVTVLALGPMTNIALALRLRPEIETKIKRIVFMGGNIKVPGNASAAAEFNFWFDPEAAHIVLRSRIPQKVMFGLDICNLAPIRKAEFDQVAAAQTPIAALYREDLGNRYPGFNVHPDGRSYMWDSLAAAWLLDSAIVTKSELQYLDVLTAWGRFYGSTVALDRRVAPEATPVTVMQQLDYGRLFGQYKELLTRRD